MRARLCERLDSFGVVARFASSSLYRIRTLLCYPSMLYHAQRWSTALCQPLTASMGRTVVRCRTDATYRQHRRDVGRCSACTNVSALLCGAEPCLAGVRWYDGGGLPPW
jgi:hypothetical protein